MSEESTGVSARSMRIPVASGSKILDALVLLSDHDTRGSTRESAARILLEQLRLLTRYARYDGRIRHLASSKAVGAWLLEEAVQHTALVASTGNARFRGKDKLEAIAWCSRVLNNYVLSELRRRAHLVPELRLDTGANGRDRDTDVVYIANSPSQEEHLVLSELRRDVLSHLQQTRRPRAAMSLFTAVCCYLDHLLGTPLDAQVKRWGNALGLVNPTSAERARQRVYQYHRRGRLVLLELDQ